MLATTSDGVLGCGEEGSLETAERAVVGTGVQSWMTAARGFE